MNSITTRDKFFFMSPKEREMWFLRNYLFLAITVFMLGGNTVAWVTIDGVASLGRAVAHIVIAIMCFACATALIQARPEHDSLRRWFNRGD